MTLDQRLRDTFEAQLQAVERRAPWPQPSSPAAAERRAAPSFVVLVTGLAVVSGGVLLALSGQVTEQHDGATGVTVEVSSAHEPEPSLPAATSAITRLDSAATDAAETVIVPDVVGLAPDEAAVALDQAGLAITVTKLDGLGGREQVVGQSIDPGTEVDLGAAVTIDVSSRVGIVVVPDVVGRSFEEGVSALDSLGFSVTVDREPSDQVEPGRIVSQSIEPGTDVSVGDNIVLVVAS